MPSMKRSYKRKSNVRRRLNFSKKRRVTRRGRARKSIAFTSQSGSGSAVQYKARRTSRRAYRKHLWDSTLFKEHYRALGSVVTSFNTPASVSTISILVEKAIDNGSGSVFWLTAGGALPPDSGATLPFFSGDITVRGGKLGLRLANVLDPAISAETLQGTVLLVKTTKNWTPAAITTPQPLGWDTSLVQDFDTRVGRIIYRKNFLLKDADTALIEYRLPLHKIDANDFQLVYNTYVWVIMAGNASQATVDTMTITKYFNLSFAADAV